MSTTRRLAVLALLAGSVSVVLSGSPASAAVSCADLKTQSAAQSYADGHASEAGGLDGDGDGKVCEHNDPTIPGNWVLIGLGALLACGLLRFSTDTGRQSRRVSRPAERVPVLVGGPVPLQARSSSEPANDGVVAAPTQKEAVMAQASVGSLGQLTRALRLVPYAQRMSLLEQHAAAHDSAPQEVLDALAAQTTDLELQGWALAGYDPPWVVRPMYCDCVGGLRNYRLQTAEDGSHFWACASCHSTERQKS